MSNLVVDSSKPAGTCHSGTCTQQGTHRLDWDTWANLACDEHTASWRHVTSPDGTLVKVTPLFRCACCIADADPKGEREAERWTWQPEFRQKVRATPFVNGDGLVGEYLGQHGHKHRVLVTQHGPWHLTTIECYREDIHPLLAWQITEDTAAPTESVEVVQAAASGALMGRLVKVTPKLTGLTGARPYLLRVTRVDVVSATSGVVHVHGDKVRLDGTPSREKQPTKAATFMPGWRERLQVIEGER